MADDADLIWNRACDPFARHAKPGDRALQAAFRRRLAASPADFAPL